MACDGFWWLSLGSCGLAEKGAKDGRTRGGLLCSLPQPRQFYIQFLCDWLALVCANNVNGARRKRMWGRTVEPSVIICILCWGLVWEPGSLRRGPQSLRILCIFEISCLFLPAPRMHTLHIVMRYTKTWNWKPSNSMLGWTKSNLTNLHLKYCIYPLSSASSTATYCNLFITYGILCCGTSNLLDRVFKLQKRAIRTIARVFYAKASSDHLTLIVSYEEDVFEKF